LQTTSKSFLTASRQASTEAFIKLAFAVGVFVLCLEVGYLLLSPLLFDPLGYAFNYDMVLFSGVIIRLIGRSDNDIWDYALMLGVWATPFLTVALGIWHIPVSFAMIFGFGVRPLWRIWQDEEQRWQFGLAGPPANSSPRCYALAPQNDALIPRLFPLLHIS
jgi:hypothetical protein